MSATLVLALAIGLSPAAAERTHAASPRTIDFGREVRPILAQHCFPCHGPDEAPREAELRFDLEAEAFRDRGGYFPIVPGASSESELYLRITDPDDPMPPRDAATTLSQEEIDVLRRWIDEGAVWQEHWAFGPPERSAAPPTNDTGWARNAIDPFILARLEAAGLRPEREAERHTLIRRATLDLTGLPPSLDELDAFLADERPDAYERLVDRLLASPRFGEHMARSWLDAARYGDTHGLSLDNERSIWPYRDWVIRAFNANLPFDRFTIEQIAGDLLPESTLANRVATGFQRCNPTTAEAGVINREYLVKYAVDRVATVSTVWMGLTMECAQCHDHKFDPITQKEYYEFYALFGNMVGTGTDDNAYAPAPTVAVPSPEQEERLAALEREIAELEARLHEPDPELDRRQAAWEASLREELSTDWTPLTITDLQAGPGNTWDFTLEAAVGLHAPTSLRLEFQPLPGALQSPGDGLTPPRNAFSVAGIAVTAVEALALDSIRTTLLPLADARSDGARRRGGTFVARNVLDGDPGTVWVPLDFQRTHPLYLLFDTETASELREPSISRYSVRLGLQFFTPTEVTADSAADRERHIKRARSVLEGIRFQVSESPGHSVVEHSPWELRGPLRTEAHEEVSTRDLRLRMAAKEMPWRGRPPRSLPEILKVKETDAATIFRRTLQAERAMDLVLTLGTFRLRVPPPRSTDHLDIWLNGELIREQLVPLKVDLARAHEFEFTLPLRAGTNELEVVARASFGSFGFTLREPETFMGRTPIHVLQRLESSESRAGPTPALRADYRLGWNRESKPLASELQRLQERRRLLERAIPRSMVAAERAVPRPMYLLERGQYDQPGEEVQPGTPSILPRLRPGAAEGRATRLDLAHWLTAPSHPLTARVAVNRFWQEVFGEGLVRTSENLGVRGEWPSHPRLLDDLAVRFVEGGWDIKGLLRQMLTSATYRQASTGSPEKRAVDPANRLLSRGSRARLDAERIRDSALFVSGRLTERIGGPSVRPYQPAGLWYPVAYTGSNTGVFQRDTGAALYRRSLYTFWKRTSPPPSMLLFDAPTRESCAMRRSPTTTPLQALALMNDEQFVEAARGLAERILTEHEGSDAQRVNVAFRIATARAPSAEEARVLVRTLAFGRDRFQLDPGAAERFTAVGESRADPALERVELAAWTLVCHVLLNLDEFVTEG